MVDLVAEVKSNTDAFAGITTPGEHHLARITECAAGTLYGQAGVSETGKRISCEDFFHHAEHVSTYLCEVWAVMEKAQLKHKEYEGTRFPVVKEKKKKKKSKK